MNYVTVKEERLKELNDELIPILEDFKGEYKDEEEEENFDIPEAILMLENGKLIGFINNENDFRISTYDNKYIVSLENEKLFIARTLPYRAGRIDLSDKRATKIINIIRKFLDKATNK